MYNDDKNDFDGYYNGVYDFYDPLYTEDSQPQSANSSCCCCLGLILPLLCLPAAVLITQGLVLGF
jgi:hypothetical protein